MLIIRGMQIIAVLIGFIAASVAAVTYALQKAPEAFESDEGLEILRQREHGEQLREGTLSHPVTDS